MSGTADLLLLVNSDINIPINVKLEAGMLVDNIRPESIDFIFRTSQDLGFSIALAYNLDLNIFKPLKTITEIVNSETAMTVVASNETAMTVIASNETAMTVIASNETAITEIVNSETAMTVVANSTTAMTVVANSTTAMTAIANSDDALSLIFDSWSNLEIIWDSEDASNILMTNSNSRAWMVANKQIIYTEAASTSYVLKNNKKGFVLALERYGQFNDPGAEVQYRYIQPGNSESVGLTPNGIRIENKRVSSLEIRAGAVKSANAGSCRVYYVQMQK